MKNILSKNEYWIKKQIRKEKGVNVIEYLDTLSKMEGRYIDKILYIALAIEGNEMRVSELLGSFIKTTEKLISKELKEGVKEKEVVLWALQSRTIIEEVFYQSLIFIEGEKKSSKRIKYFKKSHKSFAKENYKRVMVNNWYFDDEVHSFNGLTKKISRELEIPKRIMNSFERSYDMTSSIIHSYSLVQLIQDSTIDLLYYIRECVLDLFCFLILPVLLASKPNSLKNADSEFDLFEEEIKNINPNIVCSRKEFDNLANGDFVISKNRAFDDVKKTFKLVELDEEKLKEWNSLLDTSEIKEEQIKVYKATINFFKPLSLQE